MLRRDFVDFGEGFSSCFFGGVVGMLVDIGGVYGQVEVGTVGNVGG